MQEGRGTRRSSSFSGVVGTFPGITRTTYKDPGENDADEEESSVEEEGSDSTEAAHTPVRESQGNGGVTISQSNQPASHQSGPSLLAIIHQKIHIMANLQAASRTAALKTLSMKAPDCFDGTQLFKVRSFIQSCQCIFHNDKENFAEGRKKVLYAISFLIGRAEQWIEP
ncbi:hypothetical protein O181_049292 [Austropuccinia psidii MF-1]|uniref:DUF4939 domain-containing protein n=1 Tax=Austropuccinia psidii MF-1 TaxID=1389203 RepID=A0A9Q3HMH0_9BASI|nr:hypothetical protein [Austropuccinia psidii MF-1]